MKILIFRIVGINSPPPCFGMDENKGGINQRGGINSRISVDVILGAQRIVTCQYVVFSTEQQLPSAVANCRYYP